ALRFSLLLAVLTMTQPPRNVPTCPPTAYGGQIMGAGHCHAASEPLPGLAKRLGLSVLPLEPQYAHAQETTPLHVGREPSRHGAKVLSHPQRLVTPSFQRQQIHQLVLWIAQIYAVRGVSALRHQPQPPQADDVVHPHSAGVGKHGPHGLQETSMA